MLIKIDDLNEFGIDCALAMLIGAYTDSDDIVAMARTQRYSRSDSHAMEYIRMLKIGVGPTRNFHIQEGYEQWTAFQEEPVITFGSTPTIAIMRCVLKIHMGTQVEIPNSIAYLYDVKK